MKTYRKIYHQLLDYVADEMELMKEDILSSKREDCVNARIVLCQCMSNHITDSEICELTGFSQQLISKNKSLFIDRHKHSQTIRLMSILVEKFINEKIEEIKSTTISQ